MPLDPPDPGNPTNNLAFARWNPYASIGNEVGKSAKQLIIELGEKLKNNEVTDEELATFFTDHSLLFHNEKTGMLSRVWREEPTSYSKAVFVCRISCSCECGPMDDPCNQLGVGSKPMNWTFGKTT